MPIYPIGNDNALLDNSADKYSPIPYFTWSRSFELSPKKSITLFQWIRI